MAKKKVNWWVWLYLVVVLLYVALPVDLIPDIIPVLGFLDDLVVFGVGLWRFLHDV